MLNRGRGAIGLFVAVTLTLTGCSTGGVTANDASSTTTPIAAPGSSSTMPSGSSLPSPSATEIGIGAEIVDPSSGAILPNSVRTPGATNTNVTQDDIGSTICVRGWTATIRPPATYTTGLKKQQLATGYTLGGDTATGDYEEDHLVSLELGGSPTSPLNLWPEPYSSPDGARVKDQLENKLRALVCAGTIQLSTAQTAIATNWWIAYETYIVGQQPAAVVPAAPAAPMLAPSSAPAPAPAVPAVPGGASAMCNDGTYSFAAHHQGACSKHGGVAVFYT
jgi:hypothetical protein